MVMRKNGDLSRQFDHNIFSSSQRNNRRSHSSRIGVHYSIDPKADIIGSAVYSDIKSWGNSSDEDLDEFNSGTIFEDKENTDTKAYSVELQYLHRWQYLDLIIGTGYFNRDREDQFTSIETTLNEGQPEEPESFSDDPIDKDIQHHNLYAYTNFNVLKNIKGIIGLSFDSFRTREEDSDRFNPKVGLIYTATSDTTFRAAAFSTVKAPFSLNQTVQPTQIAGFNQFFDDLNGAKSKRYGVGVDHSFMPTLYVGGELTWRKVDLPFTTSQGKRDEKKRNEESHRAYLYWTPDDRIALSAEYNFDRFKRNQNRFTNTQPNEINNHKFGIAAKIHLSNGLFAKVGGNFVDQSINISSGKPTISDNFWITDASFGYRLPSRSGIISIGVKNIFDEEFNFLDLSLDGDFLRQPLFSPKPHNFWASKIGILTYKSWL